eukprot:6520267-Pyramimonas_sp.AAC.1
MEGPSPCFLELSTTVVMFRPHSDAMRIIDTATSMVSSDAPIPRGPRAAYDTMNDGILTNDANPFAH